MNNLIQSKDLIQSTALLPSKHQTKIVKTCNSSFIKAIVDILYNIVKKNIKLQPLQRRKLNNHYDLIKALLNKSYSIEKKRKLLIKHLNSETRKKVIVGGFLPALAALLPALAAILPKIATGLALSSGILGTAAGIKRLASK
jgi:hypothetical protein